MAGAVGAAIRSAFEFIEQGELAKRVETSFTQFAGDGLQRMDELREATGNLIDDTAIQQNVIRMKLFGSTIDEISETLAIASRVSRLTGEDFQATANRINDAIGDRLRRVAEGDRDQYRSRASRGHGGGGDRKERGRDDASRDCNRTPAGSLRRMDGFFDGSGRGD